MKSKFWKLIISMVLVSLLIAACGGQATEAPAMPEEPAEEPVAEPTEAPAAEPTEEPMAEPIKIGASMPLTGGFAIPGQKHTDGYQLCVDLINERGGLLDRPVELIVSDNQFNGSTKQTALFIDQVNTKLIAISMLLTGDCETTCQRH